jgi:membrane-associated protease RseP (regulator of RpoE activity)
LPVVLFLVCFISTFWAGTTFVLSEEMKQQRNLAGIAAVQEAVRQNPALTAETAVADRAAIEDQAKLAFVIQHNWPSGLKYMASIMAILLLHEMGHFIQAVRHRIPASLPFFIPMPVGPIGTMGAVIGMEGMKADRRQLFDIGVSGPLAGLVLAVPLIWIGIDQAKIVDSPVQVVNREPEVIYFPSWGVVKMIEYLKPELKAGQGLEDNPFLVAGWVGMLITGLNMMPVSQLDGGHVIYSLFGRRWAHLIAKAFVVVAILYIVMSDTTMWLLMLVLVIFIGPTHPPTADDSAELSWLQKIVGVASLAIPFLCFPPRGITFQ